MIKNTGEATTLLLHDAHTAIFNSLADAEIGTIMAEYGYQRTRLEEGKKLYKMVVSANADLIIAKASRQESSDSVEAARKIAKEAHLVFARTLKGNFGKATLASLGLTGAALRPATDFAVKALALFQYVAKTPEIRMKLPECGYDSTKLQAERLKFAEYEQSNRKHEAATERFLSAELDLNEKLALLKKWIESYLAVAESALRERADLKELIGIKASLPHAVNGQSSREVLITAGSRKAYNSTLKSGVMTIYDNYNT